MGKVRVGSFSVSGIDAAQLGYACTRHSAAPNAMHVVLTKRAA